MIIYPTGEQNGGKKHFRAKNPVNGYEKSKELDGIADESITEVSHRKTHGKA